MWSWVVLCERLLSWGAVFWRSIHTVALSALHSFLWLNNISLREHSTFYLSSTGGHLGCFYFLSIMDNDAMNNHVLVFVLKYFWILLGIYLGMEFLGHVVNVCLTFWTTTDCFPKQFLWIECLPAPSSQFLCCSLNSQCGVISRWGLWDISHEGGALQIRRMPLMRNKICWHLDRGLASFQNCEKRLFFKPHSLWGFVVAAQAQTQLSHFIAVHKVPSFPTSSVWRFQSLSFANMLLLVFLIAAILMGVDRGSQGLGLHFPGGSPSLSWATPSSAKTESRGSSKVPSAWHSELFPWEPQGSTAGGGIRVWVEEEEKEKTGCDNSTQKSFQRATATGCHRKQLLPSSSPKCQTTLRVRKLRSRGWQIPMGARCVGGRSENPDLLRGAGESWFWCPLICVTVSHFLNRFLHLCNRDKTTLWGYFEVLKYLIKEFPLWLSG